LSRPQHVDPLTSRPAPAFAAAPNARMVSKYGKDFQVPQDFPSVLKAFTREVLRCQPEDIYEFGANYFTDLYDTVAAEAGGARRWTAAELEAFLKRLFDEADADGSGELSRREFKQLMREADLGLSAHDIGVIMAQADVNNDGKISYAEFVPVAVELVQSIEARAALEQRSQEAVDSASEYLRTGMTEEELRAIITDVFQKADTDGSGHLSLEEFGQCLKEADIGLTRTEINSLMMTVDEDKDGTVSYEEFAPLCFELLQKIMEEEMFRKPTSERAAHLADLFAQQVASGAGTLSQQQLRRALVAADLGLTNIQLATILAEVDELPVDQIDKFATVCATLIAEMETPEKVRMRAEALSQIELVHGVPQSEISAILVGEMLAYDPKQAGLIGQSQLREALTKSRLDLSKKEVNALLAAINTDDSGLVAYAPLCEYAGKLLAHMATEKAFY